MSGTSECSQGRFSVAIKYFIGGENRQRMRKLVRKSGSKEGLIRENRKSAEGEGSVVLLARERKLEKTHPTTAPYTVWAFGGSLFPKRCKSQSNIRGGGTKYIGVYFVQKSISGTSECSQGRFSML